MYTYTHYKREDIPVCQVPLPWMLPITCDKVPDMRTNYDVHTKFRKEENNSDYRCEGLLLWEHRVTSRLHSCIFAQSPNPEVRSNNHLCRWELTILGPKNLCSCTIPSAIRPSVPITQQLHSFQPFSFRFFSGNESYKKLACVVHFECGLKRLLLLVSKLLSTWKVTLTI
jgi:hypothetical protein